MNCLIVLIKEQQVEKSTTYSKCYDVLKEFNNDEELVQTHGIMIDIREVLSLYSTQRFFDIKNDIEVIEQNKLLLASGEQRYKFSPYLDFKTNKDYSAFSTWQKHHMTHAILSWLTKTSIPKININTYPLSNFDVATIWDGESKLLFLKQFLEDHTKKVFEVLKKDGKFTDVIKKFIDNTGLYETKPFLNRQLELLQRAFSDFQSEYKTTKKCYMTSEWLIKNGFEELIESVLDIKPIINLQYLTYEAQQQAYMREGSCQAPQTPVQLVLSQISDSLLNPCSLGEHRGKVINIHFKNMKTSIFNDANNIFYRDLIPSESDVYLSLERYKIFQFLSTVVCIEDDNVGFGCKNIGDHSFYADWAKPYTRGTRIVQSLHYDYVDFKSKNNDKYSLKEVDEKLFIATRMVEKMFGCGLSKKNANKTGLANEEVIEIVDDYTHCSKSKRTSSPEYNKLRKIQRKWQKGLASLNKGHITKFRILPELFELLLARVLGFVLSHNKLNEKNLTEVLIDAIGITIDEWLDYAFNYELPYIDRGVFKFKSDAWSRTLDESRLTKKDGMLFGPIYMVNGGNLEKIFKVFDDFYSNKIETVLLEKYSDLSSNETARDKLYNFLMNKGVEQEPKNLCILNTDGDVHTLSEFHIGHMLAKSDGGYIEATEKRGRFLVEYAEHNKDGETRTKARDFYLYYRKFQAIHNQKMKDMSKNASIVPNKDNISELQKILDIRKNAQYILEYMDIKWNDDIFLSDVEDESYIID